MEQNKYIISRKINNTHNCIKLDLNEYDFEHCSEVNTFFKKNVFNPNFITKYNNLFNDNFMALSQKIKDINNIDNINQILLTAGSDDALEYIISTFINHNTNVLLFTPTYSYFECCIKRINCNIYEIPLDFEDNNDIEMSLNFYEDIINNNTVVYIVNPNNPLGTLINKQYIKNIANKWKKTIFIIDEAYIEYTNSNSSVEFINECSNIIITRTFSKAYGLAGLRLGYILSNYHNINKISLLYNEKRVTQIALETGLIILNNNYYYKKIINDTINIRQEFKLFLCNNNINFINSYANFISIYIGDNYSQMLDIFEQNNIYVRNRSNIQNMYGFIRITIGNEQNINIIKKLISENINLFDKKKPIYMFYCKKEFIWKLKYLLKKIVDIFNKNNLIFWLDSGSLLGLYRHNGIIPWDDDVDLAINNNNVEHLLSLKNELNNNGLRLKKNRTNAYYQIDFIDDINPNPNAAHITNNIHVDIFLYQKNNNNYYINTDPRFTEKDYFKCNFQYYDIENNLINHKFYNILNIKIPNNIVDILDTFILSDYKNYAVINEKVTFKLNKSIQYA